MKSYVKDLELLNPPFLVNKIAIFKCTLIIGAPFNKSEIVWFVKKYGDTNFHLEKINVQTRSGCSVRIVSIYNYTVKEDDIGETEVSCYVDGGLMTKKLINPTGKLVFFVPFLSAFITYFYPSTSYSGQMPLLL